MQRPSTYSEDFPHVPKYYLSEVEKYCEYCRTTAILMREAADRITELESTK